MPTSIEMFALDTNTTESDFQITIAPNGKAESTQATTEVAQIDDSGAAAAPARAARDARPE